MTMKLSSKWDVEGNGYVNSVRLSRRPGVLLEVAGFVLREVLRGRARGLGVCGGGGGHFGKHTPKYWGTWEKTARRRWERFFRESLIPTVFVRPDNFELGAYWAEGYEVTVMWVWAGRSWHYYVGRKLSPAYQFDEGQHHGLSAVDVHFGMADEYLEWPLAQKVAAAEAEYEAAVNAEKPTDYQKGFVSGVEYGLEQRMYALAGLDEGAEEDEFEYEEDGDDCEY